MTVFFSYCLPGQIALYKRLMNVMCGTKEMRRHGVLTGKVLLLLTHTCRALGTNFEHLLNPLPGDETELSLLFLAVVDAVRIKMAGVFA